MSEMQLSVTPLRDNTGNTSAEWDIVRLCVGLTRIAQIPTDCPQPPICGRLSVAVINTRMCYTEKKICTHVYCGYNWKGIHSINAYFFVCSSGHSTVPACARQRKTPLQWRQPTLFQPLLHLVVHNKPFPKRFLLQIAGSRHQSSGAILGSLPYCIDRRFKGVHWKNKDQRPSSSLCFQRCLAPSKNSHMYGLAPLKSHWNTEGGGGVHSTSTHT